MRIFSIALIFILTLGFSQSQQAVAQSSTELKIGYVNPQSILANMPEMRAVQQRLQKRKILVVQSQNNITQKMIWFLLALIFNIFFHLQRFSKKCFVDKKYCPSIIL